MTETKEVKMSAEMLAEFEEFKRAKEEKEKAAQLKQAKEDYRVMVDEAVRENFGRLVGVSEAIRDVKKLALGEFDAIIKMKSELFGIKENQQSHTFMNEDNNIRITVGYYTNDNYRDTVNEGIEMVKESIRELAKDEESEVLVDTVLRLLAKDVKGNIKASRVMQLVNMADRINNKKFKEGVAIIREAYNPTISKRYIRCERKEENKEWVAVPLGLTEAE
jgi:hypothetical protein